MLGFGLVAVIMAAIGGAYLFATPRPEPVAAQPAAPPAVVGLGYLDPISTVIKVGAPGNPDGARIAELKVAEGDDVATGQVLAILDTADKLRAQVEQSEAQVALKRLMLEKQQYEITAIIQAKRAAMDRARADLESIRKDYARQDTLKERGYATEATLEKKKRDLDTAEATVNEMEAAMTRIEAPSKIGIAPTGTLIDVAVTQQELASAQADLKVARANLDQAMIKAPFKGRVLNLKARAGERIGNDGLLEMGDVSRMRAVIEIYQTDIHRISVNQMVEIKADALPSPVFGKVDRIGAAVKRQTVINNDPATATDARVVEVFVALEASASRIVSSFSRLQVQAKFAR